MTVKELIRKLDVANPASNVVVEPLPPDTNMYELVIFQPDGTVRLRLLEASSE